MKAIKVVSEHQAKVQEVAVPKLRDDYLLCRVRCVALNPTDWKYIDFVGVPGPTLGADFCGVVEEVGSKVCEKWRKGDRVASFVHGGNLSQHEDGAFADYCVVKADIALKIPDSMSDEEAATLGVGVSTCGLALYQSLALPLPGSGKSGAYLLVNGGSSATGSLAVQYAILSGCRVIATASPHNWPILKARGVDAVFDYKDPDCAKMIREYTKDSLKLVLDCIAEGDSAKLCEDSVSSRGGTICYLFTASHTRKDVERKTVFGYTVFGEAFEKFGRTWPASSADFEHAKKFSELSSKLIATGELKPHEPEVRSGGLAGVFDGLQQLREKKVSGRKLVYPIDLL